MARPQARRELRGADASAQDRPTRRIVITAALLVTLTGGCGPAGPAPDGGAPPTAAEGCGVSLPDLDVVSPSVATQIREGRTALAAAPPEERMERQGDLGLLLLAAQFPADAARCLEAAAARAPEDPRWPYHLGHLHRDAGELDTAADYFARTLRLDPDDAATLVWQGDLRLAQGRPDDAAPLFARALALRPDSVSARFGQARVALQQGEPARAVPLLEDVLARDPGAVAAHHPLGLAYRALGDEGRAARHLARRSHESLTPSDPRRQAVAALLDSPRAHETRGADAMARGDWDDALDHFARGLALAPDDPALRHGLGTARFATGNHDGARQAFEDVVRTRPTYPAAHYSLGLMAQGAGRHDEAIVRFETTLRLHPTDEAARLALATSLRRSGDVDAALPRYRAVLRMRPDETTARFGLAMALVQLERYAEAVRTLERAPAGSPASPLLDHALARLLAAAPDDAVRDGSRALTLIRRVETYERTIDVGETMAMTLAELGRFEDAVAIQRQLVTAVEASGDGPTRTRLATNLERYEGGLPCRTPWPPDAIP